MSELLAKHLRDWLDKHYKPNLDGYLFTNSKGKPYLSDNVVKYGIHRAMAKLGIETAKRDSLLPARRNFGAARIRNPDSRCHPAHAPC